MAPLVLTLALLAQDESPEVKRWLDAALGRCNTCFPGDASRAADVLEALDRRLESENSEDRLAGLLRAYSYLAPIRNLTKTHPRVLRLAREGPESLRPAALAIAARIGDKSAIELLSEVLSRKNLDRTVLIHAIRCAGLTHSSDLAKQLGKFLDHDFVWVRVEAIESIGNIGADVHTKRLEEIEAGSSGDECVYAARRALPKIRLMNARDRDGQLVKTVLGRLMCGEFSWYRWALEKIIRLNLTHLAGPLREVYEKIKNDAASWSPDSFIVTLLDAILLLGGKVTEEEEDLLRRSGRIR